MKLAAIDIGSNAMRMQIVKVFEEDDLVSFKKLEYLRFPLRLGHDVFKKNSLQPATIARFTKLMQAFKLLIDLYEVSGISAVATSAMREAENGNDVKQHILEQTGLDISIIPGDQEARILNKAIIPYLDNGAYLHIDVGGGSTEINVFKDKMHQHGQSFKIGSVRKLNKKDRADVLKDIKEWVAKSLDGYENVQGIGTGGNINKLFKLSNRVDGNSISILELKALRAYIKEFTNEQRMSLLKMNPDRADVIIPASEIYIDILRSAKCNRIVVPKVGLKDGLIYELFERVSQRSLDQFAFLEEF